MKHKKSIGAGMLAAAGLAAGYYFYASENAKKHRKIAAKWATSLKGDVVREAKKLQHIHRKDLVTIIDTASRAYEGLRDLDRSEIERAAKELKRNWQKLAGEVKKGGASMARTAKRAGKSGKDALKRAAR